LKGQGMMKQKRPGQSSDRCPPRMLTSCSCSSFACADVVDWEGSRVIDCGVAGCVVCRLAGEVIEVLSLVGDILEGYIYIYIMRADF
jgi:hypothetical protein